MTITTGSNPRLLKPGIQALFGMAYKQYSELYSQVFDVMQSDNNFEEHVNVNGLGYAYEKPDSSALKYADMGQGFIKRFQNITYALGYIISMEALQDNKYMQVIKQYTPALAKSMRQTKETICFNILNNGFTNANLAADGLSIFNTAHLKSKGGTYANTPTVGSDLNELAIEQALNAINLLEDDAGLKCMIKGQKLIVPTALQWEARRILGSELQNDSANNALNALRNGGALPGGTVVSPYLDDQDAWYIKTDCDYGLIFQNRMPLQIDNDNDFDTKNQKWSAIERYCAGVADARGVWGNPGA